MLAFFILARLLSIKRTVTTKPEFRLVLVARRMFHGSSLDVAGDVHAFLG